MICEQRYVAQAAREMAQVFGIDHVVTGLTTCAARYPDVAAGHIFEISLSDTHGGIDYSMAVTGQSQSSLCKFLLGSKVAHVCDAVGPVPVLWLEHDMGPSGQLGAPSLFISPPHDFVRQALEITSRSFFTAIWPQTPSPDIGQVLRVLPAGVFLRQIGVMASRPGGSNLGLRVILDGVQPSGILPLLDRLGWTGNMHQAELFAELAQTHLANGSCRVDLDLADDLAPSLGVEFPASALGPMNYFAMELDELNLCISSRAQGLMELTSRRSLLLNGQNARTERLDFGLNHVKLAVTGDQVSKAKAYFSLVKTPDFAASR